MRSIICISAVAVAFLIDPASSEVDFSFSEGCYGGSVASWASSKAADDYSLGHNEGRRDIELNALDKEDHGGFGTEYDLGRSNVAKVDPSNRSVSSEVVAVFGEVLRRDTFTTIPLRLTVETKEVGTNLSAGSHSALLTESLSCSREKPNTACRLQCGDVALSVFSTSTFVATPELMFHTMDLAIESLSGLPLNLPGCSAVRMLVAGSDVRELRLPLLKFGMCEALH